MGNLRFNIGDVVWIATWSATQDYVECPDCGGDGRLRVTFHDETTVSIECQACQIGFEPPSGRVRVYSRKPEAICGAITGFELRAGTIDKLAVASLKAKAERSAKREGA